MASDMEKKPLEAAPFENLPDEIIEQILLGTDSNGFASLILLNRKWRSVSQRPHLYVHHLQRCPSFATSRNTVPPPNEENLPRLRRLFAQEIKRNLFDAYFRPHKTTIKLISNSIGSASSAPGGEGMHFSSSPRSKLVLAYNSSRIYVIDVCAPEIEIKRELKTLRRPVTACIQDDGNILAILSMEMQVDIYDLQTTPPRRKHSIILDNSPRTIALSPCGSVLAAAYEGGIEVTSLSPNAGPSDRRSVKCDAVDALSFSFDGTQILGTTVNSPTPSTVILTAPYYEPGSHVPENDMGALWTTSILFPNSSRDCSHAALLQDGNENEASWTFAYDRSFETFRAVRIDDLRNGTTYFVGPTPRDHSQAKLLPTTLSGATYYGELAAASFHHHQIWIYGIPERLDALPEQAAAGDRQATSTMGSRQSNRNSISRTPSSRESDGSRVPQWKLLCDKLRNTFSSGAQVPDVPGVTSMRWIAEYGQHSFQERLIVTASGVMGPRLVTDEEDLDFVDGGRMILFDFDYNFEDSEDSEIILEVGTDKAEVLEEERRDIETEVAIVRRRTVAQKRGSRSALLRAATTSLRPPELPLSPRTEATDDDDPLTPRRIGQPPTQNPTSRPDASDDADVATIEEQEAMDAPYANASPRTAPTLRRAATAAAVNRTLHPRTADGRPISFRRADGRREHPHESDADNWVPPPPPYQEEDPGDLPAFLRGPAVPPINMHPGSASGVGSARSASDSVAVDLEDEDVRQPSHQRTASDSTTLSRPQLDNLSRPRSSPLQSPETEDIYDVTPPHTPVQAIRQDQRQPHTQASEASQSLRQASYNSSVSSPTQPVGPPPSMHPHNPNIPVIITPNSQQMNPAGMGLRRLSNAQTWPAGLEQDDSGNYVQNVAPVFVAPVPVSANTGFVPYPQHHPAIPQPPAHHFQRPVSVGFHDLGNSARYGSAPDSELQRPSTSWGSGMDPPLIVSTPKGVSGGFDRPQVGGPSRWAETTIAAPVPVRPRPRQGRYNPTAPVQRLESSVAPQTSRPAPPSERPSTQSTLRPWAGWGRSRSISPGQVAVGVSRQSSRAERSAAKNIRDAKKNGWKPKEPTRKRKKRKELEAASSAGWTDVSNASAFKDKKCIVM